MSANPESRWATRLLMCLMLAVSQSASAQIFTYIDAQGNRVFTDQPHKDAKKIDVAPSNSMPVTPHKPRQSASSKARPGPLFRYQLLRILAPEPDSTIRDTQGNLIVTVTNDPELQPGHLYRLILDSQPYGAPGRSPVFALNNIDRGTHQLSVEIIDELGRVLERTPNQPFHMVRISLAQKRLSQPCKTEDYGIRPECSLKDKPEEESSIFPFL